MCHALWVRIKVGARIRIFKPSVKQHTLHLCNGDYLLQHNLPVENERLRLERSFCPCYFGKLLSILHITMEIVLEGPGSMIT